MSKALPDLKPDAPAIAIQRNPQSGSGRGRSELLALVHELRQRGYRVRMFKSREQLDIWVRQDQVSRQLRCLVAAGGDGTLADLLNRHPSRPLVPFPLGTENLMARYLGIGRTPALFADMVDANQTLMFDTGLVNDHRFLLMVSLGVDADVVHRLHHERTGNIRHMSYLRPIWNAFRRFRSQRVWATSCADSAEQIAETLPLAGGHVIVANTSAYGFHFQFCPDATPHDGLLDVRVFTGTSRFAMFIHGLSLWLRLPWKNVMVKRFQSSCIRLNAAGPAGTPADTPSGVADAGRSSVPAQTDGDPFGRLDCAGSAAADSAIRSVYGEMIVRVDPGSLRMLVPSTYRRCVQQD
ncbi:MAG: diacylglycerol kinase family protein [Planctomycetaceae bacterium]